MRRDDPSSSEGQRREHVNLKARCDATPARRAPGTSTAIRYGDPAAFLKYIYIYYYFVGMSVEYSAAPSEDPLDDIDSLVAGLSRVIISSDKIDADAGALASLESSKSVAAEARPFKPLRPYQADVIRAVQKLCISRLVGQCSRSASGLSFLPSARSKAVTCDGSSGRSDIAGVDSAGFEACGANRPPPRAVPMAALAYLPTGAGKTRIALEAVKWILASGGRALFVVNRARLLSQTQEAAIALGMDESLVCVWGSGDGGPKDRRPFHICTVQGIAAKARASATVDNSAGQKYPAAPQSPSSPSGSRGTSHEVIDFREALPRFDLLVLDEAHGSVAPSYAPLWAVVRNGSAASGNSVVGLDGALKHCAPFLLGLTATPVRLGDSTALSRSYDVLLQGPTVSSLVAEGVLVPPVATAEMIPSLAAALRAASSNIVLEPTRGKAAVNASTAALATQTGKYSHLWPSPIDDEGGSDEEEDDSSENNTRAARDAIAAALSSDTALRAVIACWKARCGAREGKEARRTVAFAPSIASSLALVAAFSVAGIAAVHVDGTQPIRLRSAAYAALASGEMTLLSSVGVVSEGFDEPLVSAVLLLRPTASRGLYVQQVGRGLRCASGKKDCLVLDFVDATMRHGPVTRPLLEADEGGLESSEPGVGVPSARRDEADVARESLKDKINRGLAPGAARAAAAASARGLALSEGRSKAWVCPNVACRVINHTIVVRCTGCRGMRASGIATSAADSAAAAAPLITKYFGQPLPRKAVSVAAPGAVAAQPRPALPANDTIESVTAKFVQVKISATAKNEPLVKVVPPLLKPEELPASSSAPLAPPAALSSALPATPAAPSSSAWAATCRMLSLRGPIPPSAGKNAWEKEFLQSLAALVTPGCPHPWKRSANDAGVLSQKQIDILRKIADRTRLPVATNPPKRGQP